MAALGSWVRSTLALHVHFGLHEPLAWEQNICAHTLLLAERIARETSACGQHACGSEHSMLFTSQPVWLTLCVAWARHILDAGVLNSALTDGALCCRSTCGQRLAPPDPHQQRHVNGPEHIPQRLCDIQCAVAGAAAQHHTLAMRAHKATAVWSLPVQARWHAAEGGEMMAGLCQRMRNCGVQQQGIFARQCLPSALLVTLVNDATDNVRSLLPAC